MSPFDFLKTIAGDPHGYLLEEHVQNGPVQLIFGVLQLLMATNVLVIFVTPNSRLALYIYIF